MRVLELIAISDLYGDKHVLQELLSALKKSEKDNRIVVVCQNFAQLALLKWCGRRDSNPRHRPGEPGSFGGVLAP